MTREDYEAHKEDYKDNNVSSSAFVLIQDVYIRILEEQLKAKDKEIQLWKAEFRRMQDIAINKDVALYKAFEEIKEPKDNA